MNQRSVPMLLVVVLAPLLAVLGYLQFRGGVPTAVLVSVLALHGLLASSAAALLGKRTWARPVLLLVLALLLVWYAYALVLCSVGLAAGGLADPSQRPSILALFATCFAGLGAALWLLLRLRSPGRDEPGDAQGPS